MLRIQSYLLQTPHHNILINSCVGNHKPRPARAFWDMLDSDRYQRNLAATGLLVEDIDYVMCTRFIPTTSAGIRVLRTGNGSDVSFAPIHHG